MTDEINMTANKIKLLYFQSKQLVNDVIIFFIPYLRRSVRFLALPYCYFYKINWNECKKNKVWVFFDLIYVFFTLKYYPDNYSLCRLWEKDRRYWKFYYGSIYDAYQRGRLDKEVQKKEYQIIFEDKYICYQLCLASGLPLPILYKYIGTMDDVKYEIRSILKKNSDKKLVVKPLQGRGGSDIYIAYKQNNSIIIKEKNGKSLLDNQKIIKPAIVQEFIKQHNDLIEFSSSVNTIRIVTMLTKNDDVIFLGAFIRFGVGSSFIDNSSQGGIGVDININSGTLSEFGYDFYSVKYFKHPTSGKEFLNFKVPFWKEVLKLAQKVQKCFFYYKMIGQDIAIKSDGPIIIELNAVHDNIGIEQKCGPILLNEKVKKAFNDYDLLITDPDKL